MSEIHETAEPMEPAPLRISDATLRRIHIHAEIYKDDPQAGDHMVWSLDESGDGGIYCTIFAGPDARARAIEYAEAKYDEVRLRD